jgi:CubicO group peptidase (beta-lactamase class C family)
MKKAFQNLLVLVLCSSSIISVAQKKNIFPKNDWTKIEPAKVNINETTLSNLTELMRSTNSNGVLIRNGYLVAEWNFDGPSDKKIETQSITKSITSMVLGLALKEGKIKNINDLVIDYYPDFSVGPYTKQITFWHLVTATSGIAANRYGENYVDPGNMQPGIESRYTNDHLAELARALTYIYGEPIINIAKSRVLTKIGADVEWRQEKNVIVNTANAKNIPVNAGFAFAHFTAKDLARVGWLYLHKGKWNGNQLISEDYVKKSMTNINVPVKAFSRRTVINPNDSTKRAYGYAWRGYYTKSGRLIWYMSGNGGQMCVVLPEEGIVFTKVNGIGEKNQPFKGLDKFEDLLFELLNK